jgi:aspartyl-tRNA(Asn)/glutamyl-tRNA(Gln) amidotransferase subunit A
LSTASRPWPGRWRRREISSVELTQLYLDRIARHNPQLNAFITVDAASSLAQAARCRRATGPGEGGPLTGIPIAHKDIFCAQGWLTTCGIEDAEQLRQPLRCGGDCALQAAGAVLLGKTNMDEFAMGSSNETSFYGPVKNPWDTTCVPGGSSGGSAAAVAARPGTGGHRHRHRRLDSPAGGTVQPDRDEADLRRHLALRHDRLRLVTRPGRSAGRSAADCALLLNAMAGFDERDSTSLDRPPKTTAGSSMPPPAASPWPD